MTQLLQSYLWAYLFFLGIALGSFAILAIHGLTDGKWGDAIRAPLLAAIGTLPLWAILFLPIVFGMKLLYPWTGVATEAMRAKAAYLNIPFFVIRAAIYFTCWSALAWFAVRRREVRLAGPALVLYVVTMTFASWDWMMSLEPKWWSTIYAMSVVTGQGLTALAAMIMLIGFFHFREDALPDLGNLLLAFVMFWSYLTFSQYLIIWSGNSKDEIAWYLSRTETSWRWLAIALLVFAFFGPFLALLFRAAKRSPIVLASIASIVLFTRMIDVFWTIAPAFHVRGFFLSWTDIVVFLALGAIWTALFRRQLSAQGIEIRGHIARVPLGHI
ncbi:MAG TPA: hypothetical protein VGK04_09330 [Thermoanaerobaculia bacterium]